MYVKSSTHIEGVRFKYYIDNKELTYLTNSIHMIKNINLIWVFIGQTFLVFQALFVETINLKELKKSCNFLLLYLAEVKHY